MMRPVCGFMKGNASSQFTPPPAANKPPSRDERPLKPPDEPAGSIDAPQPFAGSRVRKRLSIPERASLPICIYLRGSKPPSPPPPPPADGAAPRDGIFADAGLSSAHGK